MSFLIKISFLLSYLVVGWLLWLKDLSVIKIIFFFYLINSCLLLTTFFHPVSIFIKFCFLLLKQCFYLLIYYLFKLGIVFYLKSYTFTYLNKSARLPLIEKKYLIFWRWPVVFFFNWCKLKTSFLKKIAKNFLTSEI